jgi:hypothetical protein
LAEYKIKKGSIHEAFLASKAKIQLFGGGFANGKTTSACVKTIQVARDYPGANILIARATLPKLMDTIRKEFYKWLPQDWIKSEDKKYNTLTLINGTTINFRYVQQQGKATGSTTSNLLSATYDLIVVDQFDDPQFTYRDFTDLLGRLRGTTKYVGSDSSMPVSGPRWLIATLNPVRNWIYKELIRHVLTYKKSGSITPRLREMLDKYQGGGGGGRVEDLIDLFQGSTLENAHNLGDDYVKSLQATYSDVMADRYIGGEWGAFQGLIYPMFDDSVHMVSETEILHWKRTHRMQKYIEGFDYGLRAPSCYLLKFQDEFNNVVGVDGFKEAELAPEDAVNKIRAIRKRWAVPINATRSIFADPSMFRRSPGEYRTVGKSVVDVFRTAGGGIVFGRGNNDVISGITKIRVYLLRHPNHTNPFTGQRPGPYLYFNSDKLQFVEDEFVSYYFQNPDDVGETSDKPMEGIDDHAMDTLKYALTGAPEVAQLVKKKPPDLSFLTQWTIPKEEMNNGKPARYS